MSTLIAQTDWVAAGLGHPDSWPSVLKTTLSLLLSCRLPSVLFWGDELIQLYNDEARLSLERSGKHPAGLGQRADVCWADIWPMIAPLFARAQQGQSVGGENQRMPVYRNNQLVDAYWTYSYSPVRDEMGVVRGVLITFNETTQTVMALQQVAESEAQLRFAIDAAELGSWDLNPQTNRFTANERLQNWLGFTPSADISLDETFLRIAEPDRERVQQAMADAMNNPLTGHYDITFTLLGQATPSERIVRARGKVRFSPEGKPIRFNGTLQDITREVVSQQQLEAINRTLHRNIEQFTFVTDFMPQIVWATQPDGTHDFYNKRWYDFTGLTPDESMGQGWASVLHPDDVERTTQVWQHCLDTGTPYEIEYRMKRFDGAYRWLLARALPMRATDTIRRPGAIVRWFGTCTDIHDQKTLAVDLEQQIAQRTSALLQANADLQRSNENLERFAYVASHDLQEPLRKIQSFGDLLRADYAAELGGGLPYLDRMQQAAKRMSVLIRDLLLYSRIRPDRDQIGPVALNAVFTGILSDLELVIQESDALIDVGALPTVQGNSQQLGQLFQNLMSNALKFRKPDVSPHITVRAAYVSTDTLPEAIQAQLSPGAYVQIRVTDNGIGFDSRYAEQIFQVFQRLHNRSQYGGTGIGLAIVQKVAEAHGGTIVATSTPNQGATFAVYLPVPA